MGDMTTTATAPHPRVLAARAAKAERLANVLRTIGASAEDVAHFEDDDLRLAERAAKVNKSSADTWRIVIEMLAGSGSAAALCRTCGIGDPEGVDGPRKPWGHTGPCAR